MTEVDGDGRATGQVELRHRRNGLQPIQGAALRFRKSGRVGHVSSAPKNACQNLRVRSETTGWSPARKKSRTRSLP